MAASPAKTAALILAGPGGKAPPGPPAPPEVAPGFVMAAEELLDAQRSGNPELFAARLKDFIRMCLASENPEKDSY